MSANGMTLSRHILGWQQRHPQAVGELSMLLEQVAFAAKVLSREMRRVVIGGADDVALYAKFLADGRP
jgi:hypothetical protein